MNAYRRLAFLIAALGMSLLLAGCPGMPGAPGGPQSEANVPPGVKPPPGLESGGARTLMGTTITPPEKAILLVRYTQAGVTPAAEPQWKSCRRIIPLDACVIVEGLNYDGRDEGAEKDINQLLPFSGLTSFYWRYEPGPVPPRSEAQPEPHKRPRTDRSPPQPL